MKRRLHRLLVYCLLPTVYFAFLSSCSTNHHIIRYEDKFVSIDSTLAPDSLITAEIAPYKIQFSKIMDEVLAVSEQNLFKENPEGLLGNFTADATLKKAKEYCKDSCSVDICILNNGGLRNPLPKGNITRGNIFQLMPFENEIVILKMNGGDVKELLDFIANKGGMPVAGMRMKIKNNMASDVLIGDKPFDISKSYTIVTSDYLANGGDNMSFFANASRKTVIGKKLRDAIIEYLQEENKKGNSIKVKKDGRIEKVE
ncbi:MAG: 5'-nucleotidase C-terminal domain-containing protein [Bacteroidetes bacterium]|nr:5'-nucleotidase C-terminal domain-containing protein [Bacteroidota bacterium]